MMLYQLIRVYRCVADEHTVFIFIVLCRLSLPHGSTIVLLSRYNRALLYCSVHSRCTGCSMGTAVEDLWCYEHPAHYTVAY